jgi:hypothetical protein
MDQLTSLKPVRDLAEINIFKRPAPYSPVKNWRRRNKKYKLKRETRELHTENNLMSEQSAL